MKKEKNLLVIVDMVEGFVNEGALADKKINRITPEIVSIVKNAIKNNVPIIAFADCHQEDDEELKIFPPHCMKGTKECELTSDLIPFKDFFKVIEKDTTNGFITKAFQNLVNRIEFEKVVVVGCCTDICVENFVTSYVKFNKENNRKTKIIVPSTAVATFDLPNHEAKTNQEQALKRMEKLGVKIISKSKESEPEKI